MSPLPQEPSFLAKRRVKKELLDNFLVVPISSKVETKTPRKNNSKQFGLNHNSKRYDQQGRPINISVNSEGASDDILVLWKEKEVKALEVVSGIYSLSVLFECGNQNQFWVTGVYGPSRPKGRNFFWRELYDLCGLCSGVWCIGGDFNVVRSIEEKSFRGRVTKSMHAFNYWVENCSLSKVVLVNARYTWSDKRVPSVY